MFSLPPFPFPFHFPFLLPFPFDGPALFAHIKYSNLNSHFNLHEFYINFNFAKVTKGTQIVEIFTMKLKRSLEQLRATHSPDYSASSNSRANAAKYVI